VPWPDKPEKVEQFTGLRSALRTTEHNRRESRTLAALRDALRRSAVGRVVRARRRPTRGGPRMSKTTESESRPTVRRARPASEMILYQTEDNQTRLQVRLEGADRLLTQAQMAELFQTRFRT